VRTALDDFGTGYSSLGRLHRLPIDVLKLDKSLIESVLQKGRAAAVRAAIELGRAVEVEIVAEGIETAEELSALTRLGCPMGQGYYFPKPVPIAAANALLDAPGRAPVEPPARGRLTQSAGATDGASDPVRGRAAGGRAP
jgi:EAL domain-containing protein (putative c-di-GMP-specific phosphodiesterase class I)